MASAAFPAVVDAATARADAVMSASVRVVRGRDISEAFGDVVIIGLESISDLGDWTSAGVFRQSMQSFGGAREEVGSINCVILARDGDSDQDATTSNAFDYLALLEADVRSDPTLGMTFEYAVCELSGGEVLERLSDDGATTVLPFVIAYKIRI